MAEAPIKPTVKPIVKPPVEDIEDTVEELELSNVETIEVRNTQKFDLDFKNGKIAPGEVGLATLLEAKYQAQFVEEV